MWKYAAMAMCLVAIPGLASGAVGEDDSELMCVQPASGSPQLFSPADRPELTLFADEESLRLALMLQDFAYEPHLQIRDEDGGGGGIRYSISDKMTAAMNYHRAVLFERGSNEEVRTHRSSSLSNARDRDVLGLGMDWGVGDGNVVDFGYQLQSARPAGGGDAASGGFTSILPGSESVDHTFTFGVRRSWGGDN